jgi:PAS domain S-box-containing protein
VLSVSGMTLAAVIAEREQAEREREQLVRKQAAMEARLRLATIVESTDDAIIGTDMDGIITDWNKGAERLYGYSAGEVIGEPIFLLMPPGRSDDFAEIMRKVKPGDSVNHYETVRQKKDGTRVEVSVTASPIIDAEGQIVGASAITRDITERKWAEKTLRESEERFRLAAQAGKIFAYEWDAATDVIVRSAESAQILGVDETTAITGQQLLSQVHPDDRERLIASVAELSPAKQNLQISYRMVRPDGTVIWVERNSRAHFDEQGRMLRIVGMVADITERKRAEEALRESEARFRLAAQAGKMYAYEWDVATDVAVRSEEYANILGLTGVPKCHTRQQFLSGVHPDDRAKFIAAVADLTPQSPTTQISYRVVRPDGAVIWLEKSGRAFFDAEGKMTRMIGIMGDITGRKLGEEALAGVSRRLIEAQDQERTRIARELHDDIGQRLALLAMGLTQLQQNSANLPAEVHSRMRELQKQTSEIAIDIQSLSHELHSSRLEYLGITAAVRAFCKEFSEQQKVEIDFRTHGLPSLVPQDVSLCLFRVLQEALHNSAKHSGVRHFEVRLWATPGEIHLTVRDPGSGFDREAAKASRGLGLISMEERLKILKGTFSIESQPQCGTTIHARVPLSASSDSMRWAG